MKTNMFVGLVLAGLTGVGCTDRGSSPVSPAASPSASQSLAAASEGEIPDQDALATRAYESLREAFAAGRGAEVQFPIYALEPVADAAAQVQRRARELGLEGKAETSDNGSAVRMGNLELRVDAASGAEFFVDRSLFHLGKGVARLPMAESEYVTRAREYVRARLPEAAARDLRVYRVRRYLNDATGPRGEREGVSTYQVAVAFHERLGELPIIGAGGKVAVHLTTGGEIVSHESTMRRLGAQLGSASGKGLRSPDEARRQVEAKFKEDGVDLASYRLTRAELGYYRAGRNSLQTLLVPSFAYFYEPISSEVTGKKRLEVVAAITDPELLERLRQDEAAEAARKAELRSRAAPPDKR